MVKAINDNELNTKHDENITILYSIYITTIWQEIDSPAQIAQWLSGTDERQSPICLNQLPLIPDQSTFPPSKEGEITDCNGDTHLH